MEKYIITLYVCIDDFISELKKMKDFQRPRIGKCRCGKKRKLSLSEIVTLGIFRFYFDFQSWKHYYCFLQISLKSEFPNLPNYENFMKYLNASLGLITLIVSALLKTKRKQHADVSFVDSTGLPVCENKRISSHKVCKDVAQRGYGSKGWFYGFKLHGVCNENGNLLSVMITPGNVDDRKFLDKLLDKMSGVVVGDAGYLSEKLIREFLEKDIRLITGTRKNMKKIMTQEQHALLKKRQIIETAFSILKTRMNMATHLAHSITGLFRHYLYCILAYMIRNNRSDVQMIKLPQ